MTQATDALAGTPAIYNNRGSSIANVGTAVRPTGVDAAFAADWGFKNLDYLVTVTAIGDDSLGDFSVTSLLQEKISIGLSANYSTPFAKWGDKASEMLGLGGDIGAAIGMNARHKMFSANVWESTTALSMSIPIQLRAFKDEEKEVKLKLLKLLALCAPSEKGLLLQAPGPTLVGQLLGSGRQISIWVGNFLRFDSVVIKGVTGDIDSILSERGIPMNATVNLDFETAYACTTVSDLEKIFNMSPKGAL